MKTIAFTIQKGGTGKTTLAYNTSHAIAQSGYNVFLVDLDPQSGSSKGLLPPEMWTTFSRSCFEDPSSVIHPQKARDNLYLLAADRNLAAVERSSNADVFFALQEYLRLVNNDFDFCFIDTPPSLGILPTCALIAADYTVIPLEAEPQSLDGMFEAHQTISNVKRRMNPKLSVLGHVLNSVNWSRAISKETCDELRESLGDRLFSTAISVNVRIAESWSHHKTIFEYDPKGKGAREIGLLAQELLRRLSDDNKDLQDTADQPRSEEKAGEHAA